MIQHTDSKDIEQAQKEFLAFAAPLHKMKKVKEPAYKFPKETGKPKKKSKWGSWGKRY
jgi:hypothetical protein